MTGYLTPDSIPTDTVCRVLVIPNNDEFLGNVAGALQTLTFPSSWQKYGTLTPEQSANALVDMFDGFCFNQGVCRVIGEIICFAGNTSPDPKWLACDGSSLVRADYPDLFAVIGTVYGSVDGTHFNLPDLRGRVGIGVGTGTGLSAYAIGDTGGEETHTLTTAEAPSHSHSDAGHSHSEIAAIASLGAAITGVPVPSAIPSPSITGVGFASIGLTGGDGAHNNIEPYLALNYLIVAQQ